MIHCDAVKESLGALLDDELSPADAETLRAHLQSCAGCDAELRQLEKLDSSLKDLWASEASVIVFEPFWRQVRRRIAAKRTRRAKCRDWGRTLLTGPQLAWAIPAVIVLVLGLLSWDSFLPGLRSGERNNFAAVESIDAYGLNVALLREDETKTTVIWLYQNQEGENEPTSETTETRPSF